MLRGRMLGRWVGWGSQTKTTKKKKRKCNIKADAMKSRKTTSFLEGLKMMI